MSETKVSDVIDELVEEYVNLLNDSARRLEGPDDWWRVIAAGDVDFCLSAYDSHMKKAQRHARKALTHLRESQVLAAGLESYVGESCPV